MAAALVTIETGIKHKKRVSHKWNMKSCSNSSSRENGPTFLDFPLFPGFSSGTNRRNVFHFLPNQNF